jgi:hypothetical protein
MRAAGLERGYHRVMSRLLLNLRNVPDDEADDVRAMLDNLQIAFYETRPSIWGISAGGIWVTEDAAYAEAKRAGTAETFLTMLRADPVRVVVSVLGILFVLVMVALPVMLLRR